MKKSVLPILVLLVLSLILPVITALNGWGYSSPLYYFENEWTMFLIVFLIFFAVIFFAVNKSFKNNIVSGVLAVALSLLISLSLTRRGLLYDYAGGQLGSWIIIVIVFIAIAAAIKFSEEYFGSVGVIAAVVIIWAFLYNTDPFEIIPTEIQTDFIMNLYSFASSIFGLVIFVILAIMVAKYQEGKHPVSQIMKVFKRGR